MLVEKLGGMGAVMAILEGGEELTQKEERAWLRSLDKALAIRDILQAKGDYYHEDGVSTFRLMASQAIDAARNVAERAIVEGRVIDQNVARLIIAKIDFALGELIRFKAKSGTGLEDVQFQLESMKGGLLDDDKLGVVKTAYLLRGNLTGMETLNNLLLAEFDKANESGGYKRSGK